jgi:VIT1/CCC1 family predicted Fe2+/Mn2+ transporter
MWDEITGTRRLAANNGRRRDLSEEALHRGGRSGTLRAAVFGANDGLVSNLSLVMGVAGATADNHFIVLAGTAGLLAGAFSMAAGEYISMQSQREMFENQIAIEREEMRVMPDVEQEELAQIYRAKGLPQADAERIAAHLMANPAQALDTKVREELGLDPDELGSSWGASLWSFVAFSVGAALPLMPFLLATGELAFVGALVVSFVSLFAVGAAVSIVTGRSMLYSGVRQVLIGAAAAAVTYGVGSLIGANLG